MVTFVSAARRRSARRRQYEIRGYIAELSANSRAKDEFLAMLGHELRNPLAAVRALSLQPSTSRGEGARSRSRAARYSG
jgi:signal transduction histidine kinase